ncbi:helix-turn-helix domain-containing protein [Leucobacter tenebrionis]|uniref:helix-turn-helix domain-containing protein n=1 Tax=Leucobacter tenebrionis TaxID=2873270 RepID=UPI001CA70FBA|nr:helix-turn-helix domain-containing protein [Leucobacter tenebrionis]QZY53054.1 helix-turn-helix domain-containing protein [Leucobacter tenebrionis]
MGSPRWETAAFGSVSVRSALLSTNESLHCASGAGIMLLLIGQGRAVVRGRGLTGALSEGHGVLALPGQSFEAIAEYGTEALVISGPGELASSLVQSAPRMLTNQTALLGPAASFARQTLRTAERSRIGDYYIERLMQEMIQGLFADTTGAGPTPRGARDPYRRAMSVLEAQFTDGSLTSDDLAEAVNLSRRQLEREFAKHGTTIRREMRRLRIEHAHDMLRDPDYSALSISQIAIHVGFSGASSLARAFGEAGYDSPSRIRRAAKSSVGGAPPRSGDER